MQVLEALRYAGWPGQWYAEFLGPPPYTTVAIKKERHTIGRVYCRNTKLRNGGPRWGKLRFESEQKSNTASVLWGSVFGQGRAAGTYTRIEREVQTMKLIERVQLGDITGAQFDQLTGFFDAERLGLTDRVYKPETGLTTLEALRHIELFSVVPPDRSVEPLERFPSLETARVQGFPKAEINRFFAATNVANAFASKPEC